ncbi:VLRF1 family aeRF1-type release factor [Nonomuraea soli]|uniref:eRF1 domain-containing protein n=1 Tax=Nonomuraea soli TaxID=1032476 RepID=A0A7W0HRC5_9ACTN|nr:VLRF1 family aeRF1-type release factor [Nonomuraea soli]MBA2892854.1 hypothetical protein [Nonomuraea soli]
MPFDQTFLRDLVTMKDQIGVLSLYACATPQEEASKRPAWGIRLRNELSALREEIASWPDRERRTAVLNRLESLEPELHELTDASEPGIGRALFASVSDRSDIRKISLQVPVEDCATLESTAYVRPLVSAMATSAPAGLVVVSRDGLRLIDFRYGMAEELERKPFDIDTEDWRLMRGPGPGGGPGGGSQPVATHTDKFQSRVDDNLRRQIHAAGPAVTAEARSRGWVDVLLIGAPPVTEVLAAAMRPMTPVTVDLIIDALAPGEVAKHVSGELAATRVSRDQALVARAIDTAKSGGKGALGLNQTLALLNEGRVEHLLLDEAGRWSGVRGADGFLFESGEGAEESDLGERMIEAVLDSGATLTVLGPEAAAGLADYNGVAALLRW